MLSNLVLDCGAEAIIAGQSSAADMEITPTMIERDAIVIQTATGELVRLDHTREPVSCTLTPGPPPTKSLLWRMWSLSNMTCQTH
jgi:hypothetical protein